MTVGLTNISNKRIEGIFDIADGEQRAFNVLDTKESGQQFKMPLSVLRDGDKLWLKYGFSKSLTDELKKNLDTMKWWGYSTPPIKQWSCKYCEHNLFRLSFMACMNPYAPFDAQPTQIVTKHPLKAHQYELANQFASTGAVIGALEMGLGKSLAAIAAIEHLHNIGKLTKDDYVFWVATKSALISVQLEYIKWGCKFPIKFLTYEGLKKYAETVESGTVPPKVIIGDESHKLKHPNTQRTVCFAHVARAMRQEHGDNCYVMLMTGTPAPKSPLDWYSQCEIVRPGYLKEGSIHAFKERLAIIKQQESATGGVYPELITWRDDVTKCTVCGKLKDDFGHDEDCDDRHAFKPCVNEVEFLYVRMKGLVVVKTKAECLDLPDKIYRKIYCKPKDSVVRAMKMIAQTTPSAVKALTLLRELSDGFQYTEVADGKKCCELCNGSGQYVNHVYVGPEKTERFLNDVINELINKTKFDPSAERTKNKLTLNIESAAYVEDVILDPVDFPSYFQEAIGDCPNCDGAGDVPNMIRSWRDTTTSKDRALIDVLDDHEDVGRLVVLAGFKASIDRCVELVKDQGWKVIRLDGRGWWSNLEGKAKDLVQLFQNKDYDEKICFIGNPGSAATGLTLTASPTICYYSNSFNADDRIQSEDRIHRMGMDENRGATIIDLIHLPSDEYVLENLQRKKRLQDMSLGQLRTIVDNELERADYE